MLLNFKITFINREWKTHDQFLFRFLQSFFPFAWRVFTAYMYAAFFVYLVVGSCFMLDVNKQLHSRFLQFWYLYGLQEGVL